MTKVPYSYTMGGNAIDAAIPALAKSVGTLTENVQKLAVSILGDFRQHGDKPTSERRANALVAALGSGMRANSLRQWFLDNGPFLWNEKDKKLVAGTDASSKVKSHTAIADSKVLAVVKWWEAQKEEAFKPFNEFDELSKLLEKHTKRKQMVRDGQATADSKLLPDDVFNSIRLIIAEAKAAA